MLRTELTPRVSQGENLPERDICYQAERVSLARILDERINRGLIVEDRKTLPDGSERLTLRGFLP